MTKKKGADSPDEPAARTMEKKTGWSHEMCLALVRQNPSATVDEIVANRLPLSGRGPGTAA